MPLRGTHPFRRLTGGCVHAARTGPRLISCGVPPGRDPVADSAPQPKWTDGQIRSASRASRAAPAYRRRLACEWRGVLAPAIGPGGETPPELAGEDACGTKRGGARHLCRFSVRTSGRVRTQDGIRTLKRRERRAPGRCARGASFSPLQHPNVAAHSDPRRPSALKRPEGRAPCALAARSGAARGNSEPAPALALRRRRDRRRHRRLTSGCAADRAHDRSARRGSRPPDHAGGPVRRSRCRGREWASPPGAIHPE